MARLCHCWKDKREWAEETHGFLSPEYIETYQDGGGATCMLLEGHEGPHQWTADENITVQFAARDTLTGKEGP